MLANIDVSNIWIETKRLIIRPWWDSDLTDFKKLIKSNELDKNWIRDEAIYLDTLIKSINAKDTLALVLKESQCIIGSIVFGKFLQDENLNNTSFRGRGIGYMLDRNWWGNGLMPEAVNALIYYSFNTLNYDFLLCGYRENNFQSKRVNEKCGFKFYTKQETSHYILNIIFKNEYVSSNIIENL